MGPGGGQLATDRDRLLDGIQRLAVLPGGGEVGRHVVQRSGEVGAEPARLAPREGPADPDCFYGRGQRVLSRAARPGQVDRQVVQRRGQGGQVTVGIPFGQLAADPNRLLDRGPSRTE